MESADTPLHMVLCTELPLGNETLPMVTKLMFSDQLMFFFDVVIGGMIESFMGISNSKLFNKNAIYATT
jgi:hypothetical protein